MDDPNIQVTHSPEDNENFRKAHAYMSAYVDSLVDEYKVKKENAFLAECVDKLINELRGIKGELSEIKEQNAELAERVQYLDFTRMTVALGSAAQGKLQKPHIQEFFADEEFISMFGGNQQTAKLDSPATEKMSEPLPEKPPEPLPGETKPAAAPDPPTGPDPPRPQAPVPTSAPAPPPAPAPVPAQPPSSSPAPVPATPPAPVAPSPQVTAQVTATAPPPVTANAEAGKKPKNKAAAIVSNVLFYLCMAMLIVGAVTFAQSEDVNKSLFGFRYYYIKTASMEPVYPVGSVVFTKVTPPEEIEVGDDITVYIGDGTTASYLTHRVVEVVSEGGSLSFRTKGVNNRSNDPTPYSADLLVGKVVFGIPVLGTVMTFVQSQLIFVIGIFVLLILLSFMLKLLLKKEEPEQTPPAEQAAVAPQPVPQPVQPQYAESAAPN